MRKSILRFGALALMSLTSIGVWALEVGTIVRVENCTYVVTKFNGSTEEEKPVGEVKLIAAVDGFTASLKEDKDVQAEDGLYTITEIGESAFHGVTETITIPTEVKTIGKNAFENTTVSNFRAVLDSHTSNNKTLTIGEYAFKGATINGGDNYFNFNGVTLPKGAFQNASFYTDATIEMGMATVLPEYCFAGVTTIKAVEFSQAHYYGDKLTKIGDHALDGCTGLQNLGYKEGDTYFLPSTLVELGECALAGCTNTSLANMKYSQYAVGKRINKVGKYAFRGCTWMNSTIFANLCKDFNDFNYGEGSFYGCKLTNVDLSKSSINEIPDYAFYGNALTTLVLPTGCTSIGKGAFQANANLKIPAKLPTNLVTIGVDAFNIQGAETGAATPESNTTQDALYLNASLATIGANAFGYRTFTNIYTWPKVPANISFSNGKINGIPVLVEHTSLTVTNLYVPVVAPFDLNENLTKQTAKYLYISNGWPTNGMKFAGGSITENKVIDGITYSINSSQNTNYGYYTATIYEYEGGDVSVKKMNKATIKLGDDDGYEYDLFYRAESINAISEDIPLGTSKSKLQSISLWTEEGEDGWSNAGGTFEIATNAFNEYTNLTTVNFGTGITAIPDYAFYGCTELSTVNFDTDTSEDGIQSDITSIGEYAFAGTSALQSITLPLGLTSVGDGAFSDIDATGEEGEEEYVPARNLAIESVTLPNTLTNIGSKAFAAASIETVSVSYTSENIPNLPADAFINGTTINQSGNTVEDEDHFKANLYVDTEVGNRVAYLNVNGQYHWKKFFANQNTFTVVTEDGDDEGTDDDTEQICTDNNGRFVFDDNVEGIKGVQVKGSIADALVSYTRTFKDKNWKPISLPFCVPVSDLDAAGLEAAELYNIRLNNTSGDLEAVVWVKLQGETAKMDALKPYVIRAKDITETTKTIVVTDPTTIVSTCTTDETTAYESGSVDCSSTKEKYVLTSNFEKVSLGKKYGYFITVENDQAVFSWDKSEDGETPLNPYRFYMTRILRPTDTEDNPTYLYGSFDNPNSYDTTPAQSNVKVVVLDDEEEAATYINSLNVRDAESLAAPMYDVTGRQITSPLKGQVYIQNGVKKFAK